MKKLLLIFLIAAIVAFMAAATLTYMHQTEMPESAMALCEKMTRPTETLYVLKTQSGEIGGFKIENVPENPDEAYTEIFDMDGNTIVYLSPLSKPTAEAFEKAEKLQADFPVVDEIVCQ